MKSLPIVAIIGQTNAGKSSLFNRLLRRREAVVAREEGTTRDNVVATVNNNYVLIDTAGLKNPTDDFEASIHDQIDDAISSADLILVLIDGTKYPNNETIRLVRTAQKSKKPYLIVLNKSDRGETLSDSEFRNFGEKNLIRVSATTGQGIDELKESIEKSLMITPSENTLRARPSLRGAVAGVRLEIDGQRPSLPQSPQESSSDFLTIALIGRPNVGKSSLFNTLGAKQQAIVSSKQGTTRDVNRIDIKFKGKTLQILDTAGLRKPGKREVGIEKFSALRTLAAIEESDICCLLIDATEPHSKLDQTLAGQIVDAGKGIILVVAKSDLFDSGQSAFPGASAEHLPEKNGWRGGQNQVDQILSQLQNDFNFIPYAPVILTSSETGKNVTQIFELAQQIDQERRTTIRTSELNKILTDATLSHQPAGLKNTRPKLRYITQTDTCPPWFVVYGSNLQQLHWSYKRFLERKIRQTYPFIGTPINFSFKNRD
ncbi:50S ribosome-binding GTPase [Candidatus Saccharibacteria bacterium]|nr:50S ribosome-binding GTPase [Candidatus Saccharibacteria bacterium]